jgi:O-antigen/teichoic acid export membrane protein
VNILVRGIGEFVGLVLLLAGTVWITRTVGPTSFGYFAVSLTFVSLGATLVNAGLSTAGSQRVINQPAGAGDALWVVTATRLLIAAAAIVVTEAALLVLPVTPVLREYLAIGILAWAALPFRTEWLLVAQGRVRAVSFLRIVGSTVTALLAVILLRSSSDAGRLPWIAVAAVGCTAFAGWVLALQSSSPTRPPGRLLHTLRDYLTAGAHYLKSDASIFIFNSSDRFFLYVFATPTVVGLYDAAYRVIQPFYVISLVVGDAMYSSLSRAFGTDRLASVFRVYVDRMCFATIPLGFFLAAFSGLVISIIYGPAYAEAASYLAVLGWVITFGYTAGIAVLPFTGWNRPREYGNATATGGVVNLALNVALIPALGGLGAAWATVASKATVTVVGLAFFRRVTAYPLVRDLFAYAAISACALGAALLLRQLGSVPEAVAALTFGVVYAALVAAFRWRIHSPLRSSSVGNLTAGAGGVDERGWSTRGRGR